MGESAEIVEVRLSEALQRIRELEGDCQRERVWRRYLEKLHAITMATFIGYAIAIPAGRALGWIDTSWAQALAPAALLLVLSLMHAAVARPK